MLRFLSIKRLAVIDAMDVEFEPGLNVLTGETGAGKSILVEAVGLLLGGRASGDLVRTGEEVATIEAICSSAARSRRRAAAVPISMASWRPPARSGICRAGSLNFTASTNTTRSWTRSPIWMSWTASVGLVG